MIENKEAQEKLIDLYNEGKIKQEIFEELLGYLVIVDNPEILNKI